MLTRRGPNVSFVVPARNSARTLAACLDSIRRQKYPASLLEIVVVDNGSTDATAEIARAAGVRCVHEPARGRSHARNRGVACTQGELVAFVDSDCILKPDWLEKIVQAIKSPCLGGAQGDVIPMRDSALPPSLDRYREFHTTYAPSAYVRRPGNHLATPTLRPVINTAACVYRRSALLEVGLFETGFSRHEDADLSARCIYAGYSLVAVPEAIAHVKWGGSGWLDYAATRFEAGFCMAAIDAAWGGRHTFKSLPPFNRVSVMNIVSGVRTGRPEYWIRQALYTGMAWSHLAGSLVNRLRPLSLAIPSEKRRDTGRPGKLRAAALGDWPSVRFVFTNDRAFACDLKSSRLIAIRGKKLELLRRLANRPDEPVPKSMRTCLSGLRSTLKKLER